LIIDTASITDARVPARLEITSAETTVNGMVCPAVEDRKRKTMDTNGNPTQRKVITLDL
jgi:hypothetical protein